MDKPNQSDQQVGDQKQNTEDRLALEAVRELCTFGRDKFRALDKNNDGYLTKIELEDAAASGKYSGKELKQIEVMAKHVDDLQKCVHHTWKFKEDTLGIAARDLSEASMWASNKIERLEDLRAFRDTFNRNFSKIDKDGNKIVSYNELQAASKSFDFERQDRLNLEKAFYKLYLITDSTGYFKSRFIPEGHFDKLLKEEERTGSKWQGKMLWSIADGLKK